MKNVFTFFFSILFFAATAQEVPDFTFTDTNGDEHTLSEAQAEGKVILLDFFFVDCPPCNTWGPEIDAIAADYEGQTVEVWAISDRDSNAAIEGSIFNPTHTNHFVGGTEGGGPAVVDLFAANFNFLGFPTYSVICNDNSITWDIWPLTPGAEEIRGMLTEDCGVAELQPSSTATVTGLSAAQVTPNPVTSAATLNFDLAETTELTVRISDAFGRAVQSFDTNVYAAGANTLRLDASVMPAGIYVVTLASKTGVNTLEFVVTGK